MAENEIAIEVRDVTKSFKVYLDKGSQLKERILFRKRSRYEERKVLKGISFTVKKGEAIGLIGHNGCGKSTTLKLLTRIMYPDSGSINIKGRVSSLIELGAGFHPDMSPLNTRKKQKPRRRRPITAEGGALGSWPMAYGVVS